jgi:hypothetical protein
VKHLDGSLVDSRMKGIHQMVEDGVDRMKTSAGDMPIIVVGGGASLVPRRLAGVSEVIHVEHAGVASALGAAMAQVSGEVDQVFSGMSRDAALAAAQEIATQRAVEAGADLNRINLVDAEDIPIACLPGDARRVRARVVVGMIGAPGMRLVA